MKQIKLLGLDFAQAREEVRLALFVFLFGNLIQLKTHLQLKELLLDKGVVVQLLVRNLLNLIEDELEAVDGREQQIIYEEHLALPCDGFGRPFPASQF